MAVITIARQFGAGGKRLGTLVAEKLGFTLIDEEIIEMIAVKANVLCGHGGRHCPGNRERGISHENNDKTGALSKGICAGGHGAKARIY